MDYTNYNSDTFMRQRQRLNDLFGEEYVTANPVLIAAAVIEEEMAALRLEMTQLQIAITDRRLRHGDVPVCDEDKVR